MSWGRYTLLKFAVSFVLFWISLLPILYGIGLVASMMPKAAAPAAFALVGLCWLMLMLIGTHIITEKLSKRWSH